MHNIYTPLASRTLKASTKVDLKDEICHLQIELVEEAQKTCYCWNICLLHYKLLVTSKKHSEVEIQNGTCYIFLIGCKHLNATWTIMVGI